MGLPSSGQISINDIATEFSVSLSNVALNATLGTYASKSSGATTATSDFYGLSALTAFYFNASGEENPSDACKAEATEDTAYHNGSGTYPDVEDVIYTNSSGTTTLNEGSYKYANGNLSGGYMSVNSGGEVEEVGNCR